MSRKLKLLLCFLVVNEYGSGFFPIGRFCLVGHDWSWLVDFIVYVVRTLFVHVVRVKCQVAQMLTMIRVHPQLSRQILHCCAWLVDFIVLSMTGRFIVWGTFLCLSILHKWSGTNTNHDLYASTAVSTDFALLCGSQPNWVKESLYFKNRQVIYYRLQPKHVMLRKRNSQIVTTLSNYQQIAMALTTELRRSCCCGLLKSFVGSRHYWHHHKNSHGLIRNHCNIVHLQEDRHGLSCQNKKLSCFFVDVGSGSTSSWNVPIMYGKWFECTHGIK